MARKVTNVSSIVAHSLVHIYVLCFPPLIPFIEKEFEIGHFHTGTLGMLCYFTFGFGALPAGYFTYKFGSKTVLISFLVGSFLAGVIIFFSGSIYIFGAGLLLLGFCCALFHPAALKLLAEKVPKRGKLLGYFGMSGNFGVAVAPFLAGWIGAGWIGKEIGWRAPYIILPALGLFLVPFFALSKSGGAEEEPEEKEPTSKVIWLVFILPLILIFFAKGLKGFCYRGFLTFLPVYLLENFKIQVFQFESLERATFIASVALLAGMLGQYVGGYFSDKFKLEPLVFVLIVLGIPFLFLIGYTNSWTLFVMICFYSFFLFAIQPVVNSIFAKYSEERIRGLVFGFSSFMTFGLGAFGASATGYIAERYALFYIFPFLCGVATIAAILSLIMVFKAKKWKEVGYVHEFDEVKGME